MLTWIAGAVVLASALWLIGLAIAIAFVPEKAKRFLLGFASSAATHYLEQAARLIAGSGFLWYAAESRFPDLFSGFGWLLIVTAAGLMLVPWTWHDRFGRWAIPLAIRYIKLYAVAALGLGVFVLYAIW